MNLTADDIREFQELYLKEYGEYITPQEAQLHAMRLLNMLTAVGNPDLPF